MIVENRIKFSGVQFETETEYQTGVRVNFQGQSEVTGKYTKPTGGGNEIAIYTLTPLVVETVGADTEFTAPKESMEPVSKSPSQRLRDVLYVYWQQEKQKQYPDFENYRKVFMESIIDKVKGKLE